jgi:uncharacterized protein YkwD
VLDGGLDGELQFCLEEHNRYRALVGAAPLMRSASVEQFAAAGAKYDYDAMSPHKHFGDFVRGTNIVAENEVPGWGGWSVKAQGSVHGVIVGGLKAMWDEGPGGGHYENMKDPAHKTLGCGIYVAPNANQDVTLTVDFTN